MTGTPEQGRRDAEKRWEKYRADRVARGLPPTKREEKRGRPRFLDPSIEPYWVEKAERLGLTDGLQRSQIRSLAKRLADDATAEYARREALDRPASPPLGDDEVLLAFWEAESARWEQRAARDRAVAAQHDEYSHRAAREYVALLTRMGRL
jgi:hypothetical protein